MIEFSTAKKRNDFGFYVKMANFAISQFAAVRNCVDQNIFIIPILYMASSVMKMDYGFLK